MDPFDRLAATLDSSDAVLASLDEVKQTVRKRMLAIEHNVLGLAAAIERERTKRAVARKVVQPFPPFAFFSRPLIPL